MKKRTAMLALSLSALITTSCNDNSGKENNLLEEQKSSLAIATAPTQTELEQDADVIWMGEVFVDYGINYNEWLVTKSEKELMETIGFKTKNDFKILKYQVADADYSKNMDHRLVTKIRENKLNLELFEDADLTKPYSKEEIKKLGASIDTIITFDPETFEKIPQVVVNEINADKIRIIRVKQLIYYSRKEMMFKTIPLAVAPVELVYKNYNEVEELKPLFWFKPNCLIEKPDLTLASIDWAKRTYRNFSLEDVKVIKQEQEISVLMEMMMDDLKANAKRVAIGSTLDMDGTELYTPDEIQGIGTGIQSFMVKNPETSKMEKKETVIEFEGKSVKELRLIQDWIWDAETKQLNIRYVGFDPIIHRTNQDGRFLNSGPMFIRKVGTDKAES